jgi:protocatechuate 3,4-dioxygenase beta subunit
VKLVSAAVTGTVSSAGRPRQAGQVQLQRVTGANHVMPVYVTSQTPEGQQTSSSWITDTPEVQIAPVDASGRFQFDDVQPGQYTAAYRFNGTSAAPVAVTVPESERYDFSIELPLGEVRGHVTDEEAVPVRFAVVEIRDTNGEMHTAQTDGSGEFSVIGLPAGNAAVRAANREGEGKAEVTIEPPKVPVADVILKKHDQKPATVAVLDPSGQPLPGATVFLLGSGAMPTAIGTTDGTGVATFRLSQPLSTPVAAYQSAYGWSWVSARTLGSDDAAECTIRMIAGTGCVVVSSKAAAAVDLFASSGISLGGAFSFLGVPVSVAPGGELRLSGLPPGAYTLRAGAFQTAAEVQSGREARVTIR